MLAISPSLIDRYGHVPNGNRSYYLSRSQPPFFAAMVELVASATATRTRIAEYLAALRRGVCVLDGRRDRSRPAARIAGWCA